MPKGKKAGERCIHLTNDYICGIFTSPERPTVCASFMAEELVCGQNRKEALKMLTELESACTKN
jgi:uncharacterized protein